MNKYRGIKPVDPIHLQDPVSECCRAKIIEDIKENICFNCGKNTRLVVLCDRCNGSGGGIMDDPDEHQYQKIPCEYCNGTGNILLE